MRLLTFTLLLAVCTQSFGQEHRYQNLVDSAIGRHHALFVHSKPLTELKLELLESRYYTEFLQDRSIQGLDTVLFLQILRNSKTLDTAIWTDRELPYSLLVNNRNEYISKSYALKKLGIQDKKKAKYYKKQINRFNSTETRDKIIYYYSRPVFDNSKTFAIIQWDNGHSWLGGGGSIVLYHLHGEVWKEVGIIGSWNY